MWGRVKPDALPKLVPSGTHLSLSNVVVTPTVASAFSLPAREWTTATEQSHYQPDSWA
jgi:hypothetical protein